MKLKHVCEGFYGRHRPCEMTILCTPNGQILYEKSPALLARNRAKTVGGYASMISQGERNCNAEGENADGKAAQGTARAASFVRQRSVALRGTT